VEVVFDSRRFRGRKTQVLYLELNHGKKRVIRFTVTADSRDDPQP
jgi:hypothetical protein